MTVAVVVMGSHVHSRSRQLLRLKSSQTRKSAGSLRIKNKLLNDSEVVILEDKRNRQGRAWNEGIQSYWGHKGLRQL